MLQDTLSARSEQHAEPPDKLVGWYQAVAIEPRLVDLEFAVHRLRVDQDDPMHWRTYSSWKRRLAELVGWDSPRPELRDRRVYDACHDHLLRVWEGR